MPSTSPLVLSKEENDPDSGDISLFAPGLVVAGDPSQSYRVPPPPLSSRQSSRSRDRDRDVSAPVPQRLFSKSLFASSSSSSSTRGDSASSPRPAPSPNDNANSGGRAVVSLNEDDDDLEGEDDGDVTPLGGPSFWGLDSKNQRPSSAQPSSSSRMGASSSRQEAAGAHPTSSTMVRPNGNTRRTSSNLGRSRSLNVRLPSVDLSTSSTTGGTRAGFGSSHYGSNGTSSSSSSAARAGPSSRLGWTRRPGEPRPPPMVNEMTSRKMSRWIKEVVVCNFDLERGPVVERRAGGRRWGPGEKENVAFSSFPDTSLFSEGSILFSFKIRHIPPDPSSLAQPEPPSPMPDRVTKTVEEEMFDLAVGAVGDPPGEAEVLSGGNGAAGVLGQGGLMSSGQKADEYRKWDERGREWLYGFVWFEQRRDKAITRGYMQKSLVILTHLPFPALFSAVLQKVAPVFFEHGYSALEVACHSIASWPDPNPDSILELPLMSEIITTKLPDTTESPQIGKAFGITSPTLSLPILAAMPTATPLRAFANFLPALWSLWECLILAEPVLVIAPDPKTCSEIVWWLRDLLRPIPPAGDFRPYLHIHDHDFSLLVNSNKPQPGVVVGVTNPFFRNAASHWPNVISIPSQRPRRMVSNGVSPAPAPSPMGRDQPEGFVSRRHRSVQKDRALLKKLEGLVLEGKLDDPEGNEALRTHFQQLTERFLVPLNRYFQTLVPTLATASPSPVPTSPSTTQPTPSPSTTSIRPFSLPAFLTHLRNHGPNPLAFKTKGLSTKSRVESDFYASFCMSATFARWLSARVDSLGLAFAAQSSNGVTGNTLTVPGQSSTSGLSPSSASQSRSPSRSPLPSVTSPSNKYSTPTKSPRPSLPRSGSASIGLGISGPISIDTERRSPELASNELLGGIGDGGGSSDKSRLSSDDSGWRDSLESGDSRVGPNGGGGFGQGYGGFGLGLGGAAVYEYGRRKSEGAVKATGGRGRK
ncbi:hypothetical protein IAR55_003935 [Kwoniella newhampshirensis]|uniref:UDENN domain-containing protein n=1 Tax=Kwoniella newhampshirensis TaxID=1651941 RepID=A0AAW0YM52_9TREE